MPELKEASDSARSVNAYADFVQLFHGTKTTKDAALTRIVEKMRIFAGGKRIPVLCKGKIMLR